MRYELKINQDRTYAVYDRLFERFETVSSLEKALLLTEELNNAHLADISAINRQFLPVSEKSAFAAD